jgi:hypothetical protein
VALYSLDTSSLIAAWLERYPIANFPGFWDQLSKSIAKGDIVASAEVMREVKKKDTDLHKWCRTQAKLSVDVDDACQAHVQTIMKNYPKFVDTRTGKNSGDPFVISLALVHSPKLIVVTEENGGSANRPAIPYVCHTMKLTPINLLQLIQAYAWKF